MEEKPKSIWKKSWTGWGGLLLAWLVLMTASLIIFYGIMLALGARILREEFKLWAVFAVCITLVFCAVFSIRWLFCWRNFKRVLFGLACFATLIALFYAEEDWRGRHDWEQFKHQWEAKGEKFDWQSIVPPPVPDDQNFAMAPIWSESIKATLGPRSSRQWKYPDDGRTNFTDRLALNLWRNNNSMDLPTSGDWAKGSITDLKLWQAYYRATAPTNRNLTIRTDEFPVAPQPQSPAADVLLALSKYDSAVEELRQASRLPYSRFPLDYNSGNPAAILLPHLAMLKRSAQVLQLHAIAELQNGQSEMASDDVRLLLRLTDAIRTEPFPISHLVRIAMLEITLQPVYEGLAEHRWSEAQLVMLDAKLAKLDFLADYEFCQRGELDFLPYELAYRRRTRDPEYLYYFNYDNNQNHSLDVELAVFFYRHCPGGWFYQNQIRFCRFSIQNFLPALDASRQLAFPVLASRANAALQKEVAYPNPYNFLERAIIFRFNNEFYGVGNVVKFACAQSSVDLSRVAIALERYRLAHGEFPESLDALAPQFMEKIPHDIIGGKPLHYRRTDDGQFVLYSVGWNETDDGGVVVNQKSRNPRDENSSKVDISQGDWVWRYPAKN
jgi:hypothetical protein